MNKEFNDFAKLPFLKTLNKKIEKIAKNLPKEIISEDLESIIWEILKIFNESTKDTIFNDYTLELSRNFDDIDLIKINQEIDINVVNFSHFTFNVELEKKQNKIINFKTILSEINFKKYVSEVNIDYIIEPDNFGFITNHLDYTTVFFLSYDSASNGHCYTPAFGDFPITPVQEKINEMAKIYKLMLNTNAGDQFMNVFLKNKPSSPEYIEMFQLLHDVKTENIFEEKFMIDIDKEFINLKNEIKKLQRLSKSHITV